MSTPSNTPVSPELATAITKMTALLHREFHGDYSFVVLGRGHILAESTARQSITPRVWENLKVEVVE